jgi:hypothetical protein
MQYRCEICNVIVNNSRAYEMHMNSARHFLKAKDSPQQKSIPSGWTVNKETGLPEIIGRRCLHKGHEAVEISCPYCGVLHYHSPTPIPATRTAHCGLPQLCRTGSYIIKDCYEGLPQPHKQPKDWLNFYGEVVKLLK